ncbi:hypothetical protein ACWELJ_19470 [Nocardia sp. NPDC004582]
MSAVVHSAAVCALIHVAIGCAVILVVCAIPVRAMVFGLTHRRHVSRVRVGHIVCGVLLVGGVLVVLRMRTVVGHVHGRHLALVFAVPAHFHGVAGVFTMGSALGVGCGSAVRRAFTVRVRWCRA